MRFLTYNIQYGVGEDGRFALERVAEEILRHDPDVVGLQEVERFWKRTQETDQPRLLGSLMRGYHWVYGANLDMHAGTERDPNRRRQFGNMILSRTPILSSRNFPLPKFGTLKQHSIQQGALEAVVRSPRGSAVRVYSTHLSHLSPATRLPQVEMLIEINRRAYAEGGAWCGGHPDPRAGWLEGDMPPMPREAVIMGDLNFAPDSEEYERIIGPMAGPYGRLVNRDGFVDTWVAAGHEEREGDTCNGRRIDYILCSAWLVDRVRHAFIDSTARGSDHRPVIADIDL